MSAPSRETARRAFAVEFNDMTHTFRESDDEMAPNYALMPTGERANRVYLVGTLTETEDVGEDAEYWRGRVVDPTGTFFVYAGQYQPDPAAVLRDVEPPAYVAVVGKPGTYETDDGTVNVSVRPESISVVDAETRDRWVVETAERTIERVRAFNEDGNEYAAMAREQYGGDVDRYRREVISALESLDDDVTGDPETDTEPEAEPSA